MFRRSLIIVSLSALSFVGLTSVTLSACSSDSTTSTAPTSGSQSVGAAGGTVAAAGATLTIPAGALAGDTTITFAQKAKAGLPTETDIAAPVYEFGPDGTKFLKPVSLKMDFTGTAPAGKTAKLAWLDTTKNAWTVLADSAVSGSSVTASTDHFTAFTVVFMGDGSQVGGGCDAIPFTACGGDIVGKWQYEASCATVKGGIKGFEQCPTASFAITVDVVGTAEFAADKLTTTGSVTQSSKITIPKSCLPPQATCDALKATDVGNACEQSKAPETQPNEGTNSYAVSGNTITITGQGGTVSKGEYCVSGNTLTVKIDSDSSTVIYKAKKI